MKIITTGGTGFVGSHIVDALERDYPPSNISLIVRDLTKANMRSKAGLTIFQGDITNPESLSRAIANFNPEIVIHTAALADDWAPLSRLMEVNAQGTQNVIDAMIQSNSENFLVYISSSGVYPRLSSVYISEDTPYGPYGNYHRSKVAAEEIVKAAIEKGTLEATVIRPPNVMGPRDFTHMAKICNAIKNGKFPMIRKGKAKQTWVAAEDLARAVILAINQRHKANGRIYNVKSFEITVKELYDQVAKKLEVTRPPKNYPHFIAYSVGFFSEILGKIRGKPSTLNRYRVLKFSRDRLFDDSKIRSELGYQPKFLAEETITSTVEWLQNEGII